MAAEVYKRDNLRQFWKECLLQGSRQGARIKALAVSLGPTNQIRVSNRVIAAVKELGEQMGLPVIPVNSIEAAIFTNRIPKVRNG